MRLVVGVLLTLGALALAAWRGCRIFQTIRSGQPAVGRTDEKGVRLQTEVVEVLGQRKLLKWGPSGAAHFVTFWGFIILGLTIIEAFGALFDPNFHVPRDRHLAGRGLPRGPLRPPRAGRRSSCSR